MSGAEAIFGIVTGAAGLLSLALQLSENAQKLNQFYISVKNAPNTIKKLATTCELLSSLLRTIEGYGQEVYSTELLQQCMKSCAGDTNDMQQTLQAVQRVSGKLGKVYAVWREPELEKLYDQLQSSMTLLQMALAVCHNKHQTRSLAQVMSMLTYMAPQLNLLLQQTIPIRSQHRTRLAGNITSGTIDTPRLTSNVSVADDSDVDVALCKHELRQQARRSGNRRTLLQCRLAWRWLTSKIWHISIEYAINTWSIELRFYHNSSCNAKLWELCEFGDVRGVQNMLAEHTASLEDSWDGEYTLLDIAVEQGRIALCEFLIRSTNWQDRVSTITRAVNILCWLYFSGSRAGRFPIEIIRLLVNKQLLDCEAHNTSSRDDDLRWIMRYPTQEARELILQQQSMSWPSLPLQQRFDLITANSISSAETDYLPSDFLRLTGLTLDHPQLTTIRNRRGESTIDVVARYLSQMLHTRTALKASVIPTWTYFAADVLRKTTDAYRLTTGQDYTCAMSQAVLLGWFPFHRPKHIDLTPSQLLAALHVWTGLMSAAGIDLCVYEASVNTEILRTSPLYLTDYSPQQRVISVSQLSQAATRSVQLRQVIEVNVWQQIQIPGHYVKHPYCCPTVIWRPTIEEHKGEIWSRQKAITLPSSVLDARTAPKNSKTPFLRLLDETQDDHGILMTLLSRELPRPCMRRRTRSCPPPLPRRSGWAAILDSKLHPWLSGRYTSLSAERFHRHVIDDRPAAFDLRETVSPTSAHWIACEDVHASWGWQNLSFLTEIKHCQQRRPIRLKPEARHTVQLQHSLRVDCPQGCERVHLDKMRVPVTLRGRHPGLSSVTCG